MKTYCFNYLIEGSLTFLPLFVCVESTNQIKAYFIARKYVRSISDGKRIKVWFKNFPHMANAEFQTQKVPSNFVAHI